MSIQNSELMQAIDFLISDEKKGISHSAMQDAYLILQKKYADLKQVNIQSSEPILSNDTMRIAYLLSRMPATYSVATAIIKKLTSMVRSEDIRSLLDLGTGAGAVIWSVLNSSLVLDKMTALDQDLNMLELAKKLTRYSSEPFWQRVQWVQKNLNQDFEIETHDLVTISYALIEQNNITFILDKLWYLSNKALIIIEPGTPKGFANILFARDYFIEKGGYIIAPCSHSSVCPMKNNNWCHFAERIERSSWQRSLKGASLGYEDEAYSYLIVTKFPVQQKGYRILSSPVKKSRHIILDLCVPYDIKKETVTRTQKIKYKTAKKKKWGDVWEN